MANYRYHARTIAGQEVTGVMVADNEAAVIRSLDEKRLFPIRVAPDEGAAAGAGRGRRRIRLRDVGLLYTQLGDLLRAGVPMLRALETIATALPPGALRAEVLRIRDQVAEGIALADAMAAGSKAFATAHMAMVRAGERGGFLEDVLSSLGEFIERQDELQSKVRGAVVYPIMLVTLLVGVLTFILVWLVPRLEVLLDEDKIPWTTKLLFTASNLLREQWYLVVPAVALVVMAAVAALRSEAGRHVWERAKLRVPLAGRAIRMVGIARFCRILGTMIGSGVPLLEALAISRETTGSEVIGDAIGEAAENVRRGEPLAAPLKASGQFPVDIVEMISIAEESNQLEKVLMRTAETVERRTSRQVDLAVRMIEPVILAFIAVTIGFVAFAVYYPIITMAQNLRS